MREPLLYHRIVVVQPCVEILCYIGGLLLQTFDYFEKTWIGSVHLKDRVSLGYLAGVAYEISEYAFRTQLLYRSQVKQDVSGMFSATPRAAELGVTTKLATGGEATLPQSLKLSVQTGLAPDWLAYGRLCGRSGA